MGLMGRWNSCGAYFLKLLKLMYSLILTITLTLLKSYIYLNTFLYELYQHSEAEANKITKIRLRLRCFNAKQKPNILFLSQIKRITLSKPLFAKNVWYAMRIPNLKLFKRSAKIIIFTIFNISKNFNVSLNAKIRYIRRTFIGTRWEWLNEWR